MVRFNRFVAILAAIIMTAFTFDMIGHSADPRSDVHASPVVGYLVSAMHFDPGVLVRDLTQSVGNR